MREAVIVDAVRTPFGRGRDTGALHPIHPVDLFAHCLRSLVDRTGLDPDAIDDVIGGVVTPIGEQGGNLTRQSVLAAGLPEKTPATTIDRKCGSSQQAVHFAAQGIIAGAYDTALAGGVEMLSRVKMQSNTAGADHLGPTVRRRYDDAFVSQGVAAELVAARWSLTRADVDDFAVTSHRRAAQATAEGRFDAELVPVERPDGIVVAVDEGIRPDSSVDALAALPAIFATDEVRAAHPTIPGIVTAGNASQISDGASAVLLLERRTAEGMGLRPRARFVSFAVAADDPIAMLTAVLPATEQALRRASLTLDDIDLFEVNEAFASIVLAWSRHFDVPLDRVNVNGGAIALGHPLGGSGTRLLATLLTGLEERGGRYGMQVMCEAGGQANATIIERLG